MRIPHLGRLGKWLLVEPGGPWPKQSQLLGQVNEHSCLQAEKVLRRSSWGILSTLVKSVTCGPAQRCPELAASGSCGAAWRNQMGIRVRVLESKCSTHRPELSVRAQPAGQKDPEVAHR